MTLSSRTAICTITATLLLLMVISVKSEPVNAISGEMIWLAESKLLEPHKNQRSLGVILDESDEAMSSVGSATFALRLAADKAKELGYDLNKHLIRLTQKKEGGWEVYFHPQHEKKGTRGGGVTVHIDEIGAVSHIQRWR